MRQRTLVFGFALLTASAWLSGTVASPARAASADPSAKVQFNRDIRPILSENCFRCHGPDSASRKADLRFDRREVAVKIGAIVPGNTDKSELIRRIYSTDPDEKMPPPSHEDRADATSRKAC